MHRLFAKIVACLGLCWAAGCQDPGCIRNSECKSGFECKDNRCQAPDAGAPDGGTKTGSGAASGKGGGGSGGKGGQSGSSSGAGGETTSAPDAGSP